MGAIYTASRVVARLPSVISRHGLLARGLFHAWWHGSGLRRCTGSLGLRAIRANTTCPWTVFSARTRAKLAGEPRPAVVEETMASRTRSSSQQRPTSALYGWFTEGVDTRDLKKAKALLEELAVLKHA